MKLKTSFLAAFAAVGVAGSASAQTVINITGATAFRQAAHAAILSSLDAGATYGYQGTNIGNAGRAIFSGTINGGADAVIIRTSWSGSVAGIRAVVNQADSVTYYNTNPDTLGELTTSGAQNLQDNINVSTQGTTANKITFADNFQDNTPYDATTLLGGPIGVVAFVPVVNETSEIPDGLNGGNVTTHQLRRLIRSGTAPLQFITGNSANAGVSVIWTGRQDTSGTRVIYLTEAGLGAATTVTQYRVSPTTNEANVPVTEVQIWPTGDSTNRSIIWGPDTGGNGGYASGGALAPVLQRTSSSGVTVKDALGNVMATNQNVVLMSVISAQEGQDIQNGLGKVLAYNGVYIEPEALPLGLSDADKEKIAKGLYTLWSYEQLLYRDDISDGPTLDFIALLEGAIPGNIGGNGVTIADMFVTRQEDGGSLAVLDGTLP